MAIENAIMNKEEYDRLQQIHGRCHFFTRFKFLESHNGLRQGLLHFLLSTTGGGKSTLTRSIVADSATTRKVCVYLTEEDPSDYKYKLNNMTKDQMTLENIFIVHEKFGDEEVAVGSRELFRLIEKAIKETSPDLFVMDNLTTSRAWTNARPDEQSYIVSKLAELAQKTGIAFFIVVHTKKEVNDNHTQLIQPEDVRGSASTAIAAPYWYTLQMFRSEFGNAPTVRVCKSRFHDQALGRWFLMNYDKTTGSVIGDKEIDFNDLNNLFNNRFKLKDGGKR